MSPNAIAWSGVIKWSRSFVRNHCAGRVTNAQHKKEDVQKFAAGALANLQLYRKKEDEPGGEAQVSKSSMSRKVGKILRRKAPSTVSCATEASDGTARFYDAAVMIQAQYHGLQARKHYEQIYRTQKRKTGNRWRSCFLSVARTHCPPRTWPSTLMWGHVPHSQVRCLSRGRCSQGARGHATTFGDSAYRSAARAEWC